MVTTRHGAYTTPKGSPRSSSCPPSPRFEVVTSQHLPVHPPGSISNRPFAQPAPEILPGPPDSWSTPPQASRSRGGLLGTAFKVAEVVGGLVGGRGSDKVMMRNLGNDPAPLPHVTLQPAD